MNGIEKALSQIDVANWSGVEIGPLTRPIVTREQGRIFYIDRATTAELREAYATQTHIDVNVIVDVDFVWGERSLSECVGGRQFDYCIASHVIEHVPDMITWLGEVDAILRPGGVLSLVVPDKRYTFDILRPTSTLVDAVGAYVPRQRKPSPRQAFDHFSSYVEVDAGAIWAGRQPETAQARAYPAVRPRGCSQRADPICRCPLLGVHAGILRCAIAGDHGGRSD